MSWDQIRKNAVVAVSSASSRVFRIGFGLVSFILIVRFFAHDWIRMLLLEPEYHFKYPGFGWVEPLPAPWMYLHFVLLGLAAIAIAAGFHHRVAAAFFAAGFAYVELIDRTNYLNHYYWIILTAVLLVFLPVAGSRSVPSWVVWLLRFQVGMVYVFAGIAKVNSDWLLKAEPLATWLPARSDLWLLGPFVAVPATAYLLSWAGALFDLTIVAWLSIPRTRIWAYGMVVFFHLSTWLLFPSIGIFPLVMGVSALIFFPPDWPQPLLDRARHGVGIGVGADRRSFGWRPLWAGVVVTYALVMVLVPLRHHAVPGDVKWTGEGYLFSWHVMMSEKAGSIEFVLADENGRTWRVGAPEVLTDRQRAVMATDPALIEQTARLIAEETGLYVSADVKLSFNGRPSAPYTDPDVAIAPTYAAREDWLLPARG